jgi:DNA-binding transcriptional LysR family regulator
MDLTQLRAFVTVAREGNLTRAALRLNLTQPAVSLQIKSLQASLKVQLFSRTPNGMALTNDGAKLLPLAERIIGSSTEFLLAAQSLHSTLSGSLSIGTILDPEFTRLGAFLKRLVENYPHISTQLQQGMSGWVQQQIKNGSLDAGYFLGNAGRGYHSLTLTTFSYNVIAPQGWKHRVQGKNWDALAALPWIWAPPESVHNRLLSKVFDEAKVEPVKVALVDQEASMLDLVKSGVGLSLVRESIALREAHAHGLVIADRVSVTTELCFICLSKRKQELAIANAFGLMKALWINE